MIWGNIERVGGEEQDDPSKIPTNIKLEGGPSPQHPLTLLESYFGRFQEAVKSVSDAKPRKQTVINCLFVSATHFCISVSKVSSTGNGSAAPATYEYRIKDYSRNGTFLNSTLIGKDKEEKLRDGDEISLVYKSKPKIIYRFRAVPDSDLATMFRAISTSTQPADAVNPETAPKAAIAHTKTDKTGQPPKVPVPPSPAVPAEDSAPQYASMRSQAESASVDNHLTKQISVLQDDLREQDQLRREVIGRLETKNVECEKANVKVAHLQTQVESLQKDAVDLKEQLATLEASSAAAQAHSCKLQEQLDEVKVDLRESKFKSDSLEAELQSKTALLENRRTLLDDGNKTLTTEKSIKNKLEHRLQETKQELSAAQERGLMLTTANQALQDIISDQSADLTELKRRNETLVKMCQDLQQLNGECTTQLLDGPARLHHRLTEVMEAHKQAQAEFQLDRSQKAADITRTLQDLQWHETSPSAKPKPTTAPVVAVVAAAAAAEGNADVDRMMLGITYTMDDSNNSDNNNNNNNNNSNNNSGSDNESNEGDGDGKAAAITVGCSAETNTGEEAASAGKRKRMSQDEEDEEDGGGGGKDEEQEEKGAVATTTAVIGCGGLQGGAAETTVASSASPSAKADATGGGIAGENTTTTTTTATTTRVDGSEQQPKQQTPHLAAVDTTTVTATIASAHKKARVTATPAVADADAAVDMDADVEVDEEKKPSQQQEEQQEEMEVVVEEGAGTVAGAGAPAAAAAAGHNDEKSTKEEQEEEEEEEGDEDDGMQCTQAQANFAHLFEDSQPEANEEGQEEEEDQKAEPEENQLEGKTNPQSAASPSSSMQKEIEATGEGGLLGTADGTVAAPGVPVHVSAVTAAPDLGGKENSQSASSQNCDVAVPVPIQVVGSSTADPDAKRAAVATGINNGVNSPMDGGGPVTESL